ncbi:MAG: sensor histidine kinase, partial [Myxococcota bacterium]
LFATAFLCMLLVEPIRLRLLGVLDSMLTPRLHELRKLREQYERDISQLSDEDRVACRLGEVLRRGLAARSGCVFLLAGDEWRPAYPFGIGAPAETGLAHVAVGVLGGRSLLHFALVAEAEAAQLEGLAGRGVELVASVEAGGERLGLVLVSGARNGAPYSGHELEFAAMATTHAAVALRNARLAEELLSMERHASAGRFALALAHDVRKELDWMGRLTRRLPERFDDRARLARDVSLLQEFAEGVAARIHEFVREATDPVVEPPGAPKLDAVIERAVQTISRMHGEGRVTESLDPAARTVRVHVNVGRVLANLLDNALIASPKGDAVHLFATLEDDSVHVTVTDRGPGVTEHVLANAFKLGFTTREGGGGLGVGLAICREIVEGLGGSIGLDRNPGGGTRASVRVPFTR